MKPIVILAACVVAVWGQSEEVVRLHSQQEIAAHRALFLYLHEGGVIKEPIPLSWLPRDLEYPKGKISLIPDPRDRHERHVAVYLVNATDQPLKGGANSDLTTYQEVRTAKSWKGTYRDRLMCGNIDPPTVADLLPGHAKLLYGRDPAVGDTEGELRYSISLHPAPSIFSDPLRGKYSSEELRLNEISAGEQSGEKSQK